MGLIEVRLGARIANDFRLKVLDTVAALSHRPKVIQMSCDYNRFVLTEKEIII